MIGTKGPQLLLTVWRNEREVRRGALTATQTFCRVFCCPVRVGPNRAACTHACCKRPRQQQFSNINNKMKMETDIFYFQRYFVNPINLFSEKKIYIHNQFEKIVKNQT